jgi:hypothetical protein
MRPWLLGNTSVRSAMRLRDGLVLLANSDLEGQIRGAEGDIRFRNLLGEAGVVLLGEDDTKSVGRKWRSAMTKLGFLYPTLSNKLGEIRTELGAADTITPNGRRLVEATSVPAMQECFLRAMAAYYIPSYLEPAYPFPRFSPLRHVLLVMLELEKTVGSSRLNFIEMALIVQLTSAADSLPGIAENITKFRAAREATSNKRGFDAEVNAMAAKQYHYAAATFGDYADTNFRYLKATGLVLSKGKGITIAPEKHVFVKQLVADTFIPDTPMEFFKPLCQGAKLPTDNANTGLIVLNDLVAQAKGRGIPVVAKARLNEVADINAARHEVEELIRDKNEDEFAAQQAAAWREIAEYMDLLGERSGRKKGSDDNAISIPREEMPAYFEWILWRAFLAIDSLVVPPKLTRGFQVDQDFKPIGVARGGAPDLTFEFEDFVLVVEVTLTEGSRQEVAEGESVRRHVAQIAEGTRKPVYGLFLANTIDVNTADQFHRGRFYMDEKQVDVTIVPVTVQQFKQFFTALFKNNAVNVQRVRQLIEQCSKLREGCEALEWKSRIACAIDGSVFENIMPAM